MGVKDLWSILAPFCDRRPLYELQGKKIAIDLSCWVCESQCIADYSVQPRMYLRNLYFRTCYLLLMDVSVVFVLEGRAPELKYKTIAARNAMQFRGQKPKSEGVKTKDRSRFNHTLKQCEQMLRLMGIACVKGEGEAEALCAHLNKHQLVDGIISQDSDCFAYGARTVYRNFSISQQGNHAAKGGSVDVYDISKAEQSLGFGRNKIVALALLCGSDYCDGVHGIGKDSALKLFNLVKDEEILGRLRAWKNDDKYRQLEERINDKNLCTSCGHGGKVQSHSRKGCFQCGTNLGCDSTKYKNDRLDIKNELNMRNKALVDPNFPNESLINEFLHTESNISELNLKWSQPDLPNFIKFTVKYLSWEEIYSFEKFFPVLTRWQLLNPNSPTITPKCIKKRRNPKGISSYEIIWNDSANFINLIPPDQRLLDLELEKLFSTIEPQSLVEKAYPDLVEAFENAKKPKGRKKKKSAVDDLEEDLKNLSMKSPKKKKVKKVNTLDRFMRISTPKKQNVIDFDQSNFGDEDDLEVSDIVDGIINRKIENFDGLGLKLVDCSFFEVKENDLFEKTFTEFCFIDDSDDE